MVVVGHQAVSVAHPVKALTHLPQKIEPCLPIRRAEVNILAPIAACRDVIEATGKLDA
jgi:hypothetical protein